MMSAFKKQRKSLYSKLKIKNQINVIDAFLSSSLLTLNTFSSLNLYHANVRFYATQEISENVWIFDVFSFYKIGTLA